MARVLGSSGSLTDLLLKVNDEFIRTLQNVVNFTKSYDERKRAVFQQAREEVENRLVEKQDEIEHTKLSLSDYQEGRAKLNAVRRVMARFQEVGIQNKLTQLSKELSIYEGNIESLVEQRAQILLFRLNRIDAILRDHKHLIYGAMGEERVIAELAKLPNDFFVINDYRRQFNPPIFNKNDDDRIYSVQIDHVVVGPTGIFLIETKNWSKESIQNEDFYSPVQQVKRAAFAMFVFLNNCVDTGYLNTLKNSWGARKISPKQVVVSINPVPHTDFQFVKVLNIENLNQHILVGRKVYEPHEAQAIAELLAQS